MILLKKAIAKEQEKERDVEDKQGTRRRRTEKTSVFRAVRGLHLALKTLVLGLVVAALLYLGTQLGPVFANKDAMLMETVARLKENVKELATIKYYYTDVGSFENYNEVIGLRIPMTTKKFIVSYDGTLTIGVKLNKMQVDLVGNRIEVKLPKAEVLNHEMDENSTKFFDQKSSAFNPIKLNDFTEFLAVKKQSSINKIVTHTLLEEAREEAKKIIKQLMLVSPDIAQNYEVVFVD